MNDFASSNLGSHAVPETAVHNQPPELKDWNPYASDPVLSRAVLRGGAGWHESALVHQGAECGSEATLRDADDVQRYPPELQSHDRAGERIDVVRFHPAWHRMMDLARRHGVVNLSHLDDRPSAWTARAAAHVLHCQAEPGSSCPTTMTHAAIPVLRRHPALHAALATRLAAREHDPRDLPIEQKFAVTLGMGMTERQGGSDVRGNLTQAVPLQGQTDGPWGTEFLITGHKWFFSAPMCDAHLVLARERGADAEGGAELGLSCFFVPRWRPDGGRNTVHLQRLKDKVGNRSNASAEVEFAAAWGVRVGEPGRGIGILLEMATLTRLDCALSSAAFMRQGLVQSLHHARWRKAFGKPLAEQPLMRSVLADMALESEAAMLLAMDLAGRFGQVAAWQQRDAGASGESHLAPDSDSLALDLAWRRLMTPVAKYWNCKRAVAFAGEAMEVLGGNGYVESSPLARLFREAPVNAIWEGSGNIMCLDMLRVAARHREDTQRVLQHLDDVAGQAGCAPLQRLVQGLAVQFLRPAELLEPRARHVAQQLALAAQGALMLQFGSPAATGIFVDSRLDPDWGAAWGGGAQALPAQELLAQAWTA